jgi:hypothetical protein
VKRVFALRKTTPGAPKRRGEAGLTPPAGAGRRFYVSFFHLLLKKRLKLLK